MKWTRFTPGVYTAGPWMVTSGQEHRPIWTATGPGLEGDSIHGTKALAQRAAESAASQRASDPATVPVVGDAVAYAGIRCRVTAIMATVDGTPLYCLLKARGKRQCLLREEFEVVIP